MFERVVPPGTTRPLSGRPPRPEGEVILSELLALHKTVISLGSCSDSWSSALNVNRLPAPTRISPSPATEYKQHYQNNQYSRHFSPLVHPVQCRLGAKGYRMRIQGRKAPSTLSILGSRILICDSQVYFRRVIARFCRKPRSTKDRLIRRFKGSIDGWHAVAEVR
jgi:hypothetical protein